MIALTGKVSGCDITITITHSENRGMVEPSFLEIDACATIQHHLSYVFAKDNQCGCPPNRSCLYIQKHGEEPEFFTCDVSYEPEDLEKAQIKVEEK